jgi:CHAT domain-containing protein/tetratricopeptide (TPR) repeat protein
MSRRVVVLCCLGLFAYAYSPSTVPTLPTVPPDANGPITAGVVVEKVEPAGAAARASLRRGDVLLSWRRGAAAGDLRSPFDVSLVEIEQSPRGTVRLTALRDGRPASFDLAPRRWRMTTRPNFAAPLLDLSVAGTREMEANRIPRGLAAWRDLAGRLGAAGRNADGAWLACRIAESAARAGRWTEAQESYRDAVRLSASESGGLQIGVSDSYATALLRRNLFGAASAEYRKALPIASRDAPDSLAVAFVLEGLGSVEESAENFAAARDFFSRALVIRQRIAPDSLAVAESLGALGRVAAETDSAEDLCSRALAIAETIAPDGLEAARAMNDLGSLAFSHGDLTAARRLHERALEICRKADPGGLDMAASLYGLGNVAWRRGDLATAEDLHQRALALRQSLAPDGGGVVASLNALGNVAGTRKDLGGAERYHRQALAIGEKRAPRTVDAMLHNLGEDARLMGRYDAAEALLARAMSLYDRLPPGSQRDVAVANTLVSLAAVSRDRGDLAEAEARITRALAIRETHEPDTLHLAEDREVLAGIQRERGRLADARATYEQVLQTASRAIPGSELEARALHSLGELDRKEGRAGSAAEMFGRAVDALDAQKGRVGGPMEARELFSAVYADYYRDDIEALVDRDRPAEAFHVLERSRARLLLAMLAERDLVLPSDLPPDLEEERSRTDAEYDRTQRQLLELSPKERGRRQELRERLGTLRARRAETIEKIKKASPRYASLRYPEPLDLAGARAALDPGTLLLAYSVGKEHAYLFAVEPADAGGSGVTVFRLPGSDRSLREAVGAHRNLLDFRGVSGPDASRHLRDRSRSLYDTLLAPAEPLIMKYDRLLIVPDGPLHTLPWAALTRAPADSAPMSLIEWKPVHTAISATTYRELKKSRPRAPRDPAVRIAAFGDPRYPGRIAARNGGDEALGDLDLDGVRWDDSPPQLRSAMRGGLRFEPLPESRREVQEIVALFAPKAAAYLGPDATEENARSVGKDVPLIHYACHAVVNERFPLDSALAFSIPEKAVDGQDNGLLQAWEIFERVRLDADLVTLSACESGLGREMGGEGLIGLTRAFQYAGARSVLASLWKVEDKATYELMKRFYRYVKEGKTKDEALRLAQIDLLRSAEFSRPRDWAAFQLNGDWR